MFRVYAKHYLTQEGISYFRAVWFNRVQSIMKQQQGYISFVHDASSDVEDCVNVIVTFVDEARLLAWVAHPEHDNLVDALDSYRSRSYWEYAVAREEVIDRSKLTWEREPNSRII